MSWGRPPTATQTLKRLRVTPDCAASPDAGATIARNQEQRTFSFGNRRDAVGFVERFKDGPDNVVVLRYAAAFYWLMWPVLAVTV